AEQRPPDPVAQRAVAQRPSGPVGPRPPYQIRVRRTGVRGEQGLGPVYTDTLSLLETSALEELLGRAEFFALPSTLHPDRPHTGDVRQEITVISAGRSHTVGYDLGGSRRPAELDEFVSRLERIAQWRGPASAPVATAGQAPPSGHPPALAPAAPVRAPQPLFAPQPSPPPKPWYTRPAALAGLAAALVLAIVLTVVLATGGSDPLLAPDSVEVVATASSVELTWNKVEGALRYQVRRDGDLLDTTSETSFVDEAVEGGQEYRYTVVALGSGEAQSPARARSVTVPEPRPAPPAPQALQVLRESGEVHVSWDGVDGASTYNLFRGTVRVYAGAFTTYVDDAAPLGTNQYSVLAVASDGTLSERSRAVPITLSDSWGALAEIVAAFPNLLPSNPTENGYEESVCGVGGVELDSLAEGIAVCDYPNGIHLELRLYADQAALGERTTQVASGSDGPTEWLYEADDGTQTQGGLVYESRDGEDPAYRFASFLREDRVLIGLYVQWYGHSEPELFSQWWLPAPF
nr:hypothetical protein [Geodermatophilaceae bacterium]